MERAALHHACAQHANLASSVGTLVTVPGCMTLAACHSEALYTPRMHCMQAPCISGPHTVRLTVV
jgi:hypothetical protein